MRADHFGTTKQTSQGLKVGDDKQISLSQKIQQLWNKEHNLDNLFRKYRTYLINAVPSSEDFKTLVLYCKISGQQHRALSLWGDICKYAIIMDKTLFDWMLRTSCNTSFVHIDIARELFQMMENKKLDFDPTDPDFCSFLLNAFHHQGLSGDIINVGR